MLLKVLLFLSLINEIDECLMRLCEYKHTAGV